VLLEDVSFGSDWKIAATWRPAEAPISKTLRYRRTDMALFPEVTIKSKKSTEKFKPLHVDQFNCSVNQSGQSDLGVQSQGVEYAKSYVYIDISNIKQIPKRQTRALFDMFFDAQDHENILDIDVVFFQDSTPQQKEVCRYKYKGWITQYVIIDPVTDLRRYVNRNWDPVHENWQSNFPTIGGKSYMALLRLELTAATDEENKPRNKCQ
jgi:hypothetical protein